MTQYIAVEVQSTDEILMALLADFEFEAFEEEDNQFTAYIVKEHFDTPTQKQVIELIQSYTDRFRIYEPENKNWNAIWEASFEPVVVEDFCQIRADFHPPIPNINYDLVINPKMAFGTGHHATTWMMIKQMSDIQFNRKSVFDFGCGTGILAILASKMGADAIDAIDIEHESFLNTIENASVNNVNNIETYEGDLDVMPSKKYDIILANINRNILIKYARTLSERLHPNGIILLSGILNDDQDIVTDAFRMEHLYLKQQLERENWVCLRLEKHLD